MRIVQIVPGSGDSFYCENCVRDNALVRALLDARQDVIAVPLYLPRIGDRLAGPQAPIFFGGINAYLQQRYRLFRRTPRWLDRIFDSSWLLRLAARRAGSVRASGLGEMTLSMLQGRDGNQGKELLRLVQWLEGIGTIDVVHLSNPLLLGIGAEIKRRFGVPVVCSLQDEDTWIDGLEEPYPKRCWDAMSDGAQCADAFVSVSRYFGDLMQERMRIPPERLHVVPIGVDPAAFEPSARPPDPPVLGYLSRMTESLGLGILVEAFLRLRRHERFRSLRLHVSGGATADDAPFLAGLRRALRKEDATAHVTFFDPIDAASRADFLRSLTVLSVPAPNGMAFGTYILEALAAGVPVVEPQVGSFPEILEATGGGVLFEPCDPDRLAAVLAEFLDDPRRLAELGRRGREAVEGRFGLADMAESMLGVYRAVAPGRAPRTEQTPDTTAGRTT